MYNLLIKPLVMAFALLCAVAMLGGLPLELPVSRLQQPSPSSMPKAG